MKKILITGGNGFIGTNLLLAIREKNVNNELAVYIVDLAKPKIELEENERWLYMSIMDRDALIKSFLDISPDFVIHLAAETSCDPTMKMDDYKVNT
ncbi:MAG TPA: NAD-dependent epimerase/dehydratase family protein, partial [Flavitalea sp.]|nr:NAD-dependent epimerase/dehydratase family protein [Flavitalea sp.]